MSEPQTSPREADRQPAGGFAQLDQLLDEINHACDALSNELDEFDAAPHGPPPEELAGALVQAVEQPPAPIAAPDAPAAEDQALLASINAELTGIEAELGADSAVLGGGSADPGQELTASPARASDATGDDPFAAVFEDPDTGQTTPASIGSERHPAEVPAPEPPAISEVGAGVAAADGLVERAETSPTEDASASGDTAEGAPAESGEPAPAAHTAAESSAPNTLDLPPAPARADTATPRSAQAKPKPRGLEPLRAVLARALDLIGRPLANQPRVVRDSIGWIGAVTVFYGLCVWLYLLVFHDPSPPGASTRPAAIVAPTPDGGSVEVPEQR